MTNEETEQLIAEIKYSSNNRIIATSNIEAYQEAYIDVMENIEKIINRFANKPPYEYIDSKGNAVTLRENSIEVHNEGGDLLGDIDFYCKGELVCLKNNINKMLEYLKGD